MRARVKADLARRGITSADLEGMTRDTHVDGDVTGWTWAIHLNAGRSDLVYTMDNEDDAELRCNGELVPDFHPVN